MWFCNSAILKVEGTEKVFFNNGIFAHSLLTTEDQSQICYQAKAYGRVIQSFSGNESNYQEASTILPQALRNVCRDKDTGATIRDQTDTWSGKLQTIAIGLASQQGGVDVTSDEQCPAGLLHFDVKLKQWFAFVPQRPSFLSRNRLIDLSGWAWHATKL